MLKRATLLLISVLCGLIASSQSKNLSYYLEQADKNSPLLNEYKNQAASARYDSMLVFSSRKPQVEFNTSLQYSPYNDKFGYDEVITDGGNYSVLAGVTQNIFSRREYENRLLAASLLRNSALNSAEITRIDLVKVVTSQYLTAYADQTDIDFNTGFLDLFRKELEITGALVKTGSAKETDYLSLLNEAHAQEILIKQLKRQLHNDVYLLNQLCGIYDSVRFDLQQPDIHLDGRADVKKDPSFMKFTIDSLRMENDKNAIDIRYRPRIKWFADAGLLTSTPWNFYRHFGFSAGLSLAVPIYDGNQRNIEKNKLILEENSRQFYRDNYQNQYYFRLKQLEDEMNMLNEIEASVDAQLKTAVLLSEALKKQLESGIVQMTEYINALRSQKTASRDINMIRIGRMQVINEINSVLKKY
ncbi:MAG TPA: TolC family protein [Bacteroidales bacterium]|nr:TolC family protein [Bacteroidales bacterium]